MRTLLLLGVLFQGLSLNAQTEKAGEQLPPIPEFPAIPAKKAENTVALGNSDAFAEVKLNLPISEGPFKPTWASIEANYPGEPAWLRKAKFGIWVHFGPQSAGESGDWYARYLYVEGKSAYTNHRNRYGHPSQVGYKEVLRDWNPTKLDPDYLTKLYKKAGARFLMIQGVHHDNFDLWNSQYQPWNSVNMGPKRDLLAEWAEACKAEGMRYGVTFHHEYTWWWWQTAFASDQSGTYAGVPYDGNLTLEDGVGKWWEGYDPRLLYGINLREYKTVAERANGGWSPPDAGIFINHLDYCKWYATQWALRMMDVTANYDPDFIYTDGTVQGPFTGNGTGTGYKCDAMQTVMADFYNRVLKKRGNVDAFSIIKFRSPTNGAVNTAEFGWPGNIDRSQPWIREAPVGDWFYAPGFTYDSGSVVHFIIESISRDGNAALNIPIRPDGSLDDACVTMLENVGKWMDINGQAVYGSKAWKTLGESESGAIKTFYGGGVGADVSYSPQELRFTEGEDGKVYAFTMAVPKGGSTLRIQSLGMISEYYSGKVDKVTLLGYGDVEFENDLDALIIHVPTDISCVTSAVFAITIDSSTIEKPNLSDVIQMYEEKLNEAIPQASYNTGKPNPIKVEAFSKQIDAARAALEGTEEEQAVAIASLRSAYITFKQTGFNPGGTPDDIGMTDITTEYLVEKNNFSATEMGSRFGKPANWTVENYSIPQRDSSRGTKNGIDNFPGYNTLMLGKWGDEDATPSTNMTNARIYRQVHLPAGHYFFGAKFNTLYNLGTSYIYAANEPLNFTNITKSINRLRMNSCASDGKFYGITFDLDTEQDVVLAFQANMQSGNTNQEFRIDEVKLLYSTSSETPTQTNITKEHLIQATHFSRISGQSTSTRYGTPANWTVENYKIPTSEGTRNGLDRFPGYDCLTLGVWGDRQNNTEGDLTNARVYRKVNLEAGHYYFGATYEANYQLEEAYIFAASETLATTDIPVQSIAFDPIADAGRDNSTYRGIYFELSESQEVLLGFQANLNVGAPEQEFRASNIKLIRFGEPTGIDNVIDSSITYDPNTSNYIFTLSGQFAGTDLNKLSKGVYIYKNRKVIIK